MRGELPKKWDCGTFLSFPRTPKGMATRQVGPGKVMNATGAEASRH